MTVEWQQSEANRIAARKLFIEKRRHELAGLVLDGVTGQRHGAELALWARGIMHRTDAMLGLMFDDLIHPPRADLSKATEAEKKLAAEVGNRKPPVKT